MLFSFSNFNTSSMPTKAIISLMENVFVLKNDRENDYRKCPCSTNAERDRANYFHLIVYYHQIQSWKLGSSYLAQIALSHPQRSETASIFLTRSKLIELEKQDRVLRWSEALWWKLTLIDNGLVDECTLFSVLPVKKNHIADEWHLKIIRISKEISHD